MSDILGDEVADMTTIVDQVKDESRRKELRSHDEKEDYLDEGSASTSTRFFAPFIYRNCSGCVRRR